MPQSFIPKDKPKSWVVFVIAVLSALLIFGPLAFLAGFLQWAWLYSVAIALFIGCWLLAMFAGAIFGSGHVSGQYKNVEKKEWKDQVW